MSKRIWKSLSISLILLLAFFFACSNIMAIEMRSGEIVTITNRETLNEELYVAGKEVIIDGTVNDDVFAAGEIVTINGDINGDIFVCGREVTVNGTVQRSVIAAGERIYINGDVKYDIRATGRIVNIKGIVSGDITVMGNQLDIAKAAVIVGDMLFGGKDVSIAGSVESEIMGGGKEVSIGSEVKGDVEIHVEKLSLLPGARIQGDLTYTSKDEANINSEQVDGTITHKMPEKDREKKRMFPFVLFFGIGAVIIGFLMCLLFGTLVILIFPNWLKSSVATIGNKPGISAGWGAIILFATPVAAVVACITVIGIPVGLTVMAIYLIALYLSQILVSLFVGKWMVKRFREVNTKAAMFGSFALGLFIFKILRLIPFLGGLITLAVLLFGLGAIVISLWNLRTKKQETSPTEPTEENNTLPPEGNNKLPH